jgi:hypothetical protein
MAESVPGVVEENAPTIRLHPKEEYPPADPADWLGQCKLYWYTGDDGQLAFPESAAELFARGALGGDFRFDGRGLGEPTRPWEGSRPKNEQANGFALTTDEDEEPGAPLPDPVPVFYEHVEGQYVTYWIYFPWSTVPRKIVGLRDILDLEAQSAESAANIDNAAVALWETYPDLVESAVPDGPEAFSLRDTVRAVANWIGRRWPVLHEGDWEGVSVAIAAGEPRRVAYFQHGKPEVRGLESDERPNVVVANGSHASYPDVDPFSPGSRLVKNFEELATGDPIAIELFDVRSTPWYGFGGAWGKPGENSSETGPLGPGPSKGPRPFARQP